MTIARASAYTIPFSGLERRVQISRGSLACKCPIEIVSLIRNSGNPHRYRSGGYGDGPRSRYHVLSVELIVVLHAVIRGSQRPKLRPGRPEVLQDGPITHCGPSSHKGNEGAFSVYLSVYRLYLLLRYVWAGWSICNIKKNDVRLQSAVSPRGCASLVTYRRKSCRPTTFAAVTQKFNIIF